MANIYTETIATADDIEIKTYYKRPIGVGLYPPLQNVYVDSIDVEGDTVNARIGETDDYIDYDKDELFAYINFNNFSSTAP